MNTKGLIGRKIVEIRQDRISYDGRERGSKMCVASITLDNGIVLYTQPMVTENDVHGDMSRSDPQKKKRQ